MKIVLLTNITPSSENIRGTSALPYHLMLKRSDDIEIDAYSFNFNKLDEKKIHSVEKELKINISILAVPLWFRLFFHFRLLPFRAFLRYPIHNYLKLNKKQKQDILKSNPESIWIYGEEMSRISRQFADFKRVHTLPDAESLYYYRMLRQSYVVSNDKWYRRLWLMLPKFMRMERDFDSSNNIKYHVVGEKDAEMLHGINPQIDVRFIRHPHYMAYNPPKVVSFGEEKIKLLLAGQKNVYMSYGMAEVLNCLKDNNGLKDYYVITFLGKNWEKESAELQSIGYNVKHVVFAANYIDEIIKHDIQITPINIGTGTKGKVLDALANGLLVIGTHYAMENIAVENRKSCIIYNNKEELKEILCEVVKDKDKFEKIAEEGRKSVLLWHGRDIVSTCFFSLFK